MSSELQAGGESPLASEDLARANLYALVGRLFYDAPDALLLAEICRAEGERGDETEAMPKAWAALRTVAKSAYPVVLKQEHDRLFVGVGRAEITPYTSHYVGGSLPDRHLVSLREQLSRLGLTRRSAAFEVEDHVSGICDVMRFLVLEGRDNEEQRLFFNEFVYPGLMPFLNAVIGSESSVFYRAVAEFARAYFEIERAAFDMQ